MIILAKILNHSFFSGKRVLVTGHTGFIGSWLTKCLSMVSADICGYALDPPSNPSMFEALGLKSEILDVRGDIRDRNHLRETIKEFKPEIVFHLAAQPIVLNSYDEPFETFDTNVTGTVSLLDELRKVKSIETIIVVTSDKSYRNEEWVYPYREIDALGGKDPYSASKSCQDIVVNSFRESYFSNSGVGISSIRAGNVIGGGDWADYRIIPDIIRSIVKGETLKIRNPNSVRPWQHVLEPISGMLMLAEKMPNNKEFNSDWNFGPEYYKEVTVKDLAETFIGLWGTGNYVIETKQEFKEANYLRLDVSKAKGMLSWSPKYTFNTAAKNTVDWYKEYYSNKTNIVKITEDQIKNYFFIS